MVYIFTQQPPDVDLAFGPVIATTRNTFPLGTPGLVIKRFTDDSVVASLRQQVNAVGYTHFDISKILQSELNINPTLETTAKLSGVPNESFEYYLQAGYYDDNEDFQFDATSAYKSVFYGRKSFTEVLYNSNAYRPNFTNDGTNNIIDTFGIPLTNRDYNVIPSESLSGAVPDVITGSVCIMERMPEDSMTITWMNNFRGTPLSTMNGINGFTAYFYDDSNTQISSVTTLNTTPQGGGPNALFDDVEVLRAQFEMISHQVGVSYSAFDNDNFAYFYVCPWAYQKDPDTSSTDRVYAWQPVRINIDRGECNDFSPIQVSWVNEFGVKDYFSFQKRNDKNISVNRKEYNKEFSDWSEVSYNPAQTDRGRTTFATTIEETHTANTRYLTDAESTYLKNLYISPEVKVRFDGDTDFTPVVLTDTQYTERTFRKDKLFQHTINFKLANQQQIQNG